MKIRREFLFTFHMRIKRYKYEMKHDLEAWTAYENLTCFKKHEVAYEMHNQETAYEIKIHI